MNNLGGKIVLKYIMGEGEALPLLFIIHQRKRLHYKFFIKYLFFIRFGSLFKILIIRNLLIVEAAGGDVDKSVGNGLDKLVVM